MGLRLVLGLALGTIIGLGVAAGLYSHGTGVVVSLVVGLFGVGRLADWLRS